MRGLTTLTASRTVCDVGDPRAATFRECVTDEKGNVVGLRHGVIVPSRDEELRPDGEDGRRAAND